MHEEVLSFWFREIDPKLWWSAEPGFDELVRQRFLSLLLGIFAAVALLLAAIGFVWGGRTAISRLQRGPAAIPSSFTPPAPRDSRAGWF